MDSSKIDEYISKFEGKTKHRLLELNTLIKTLLPDAEGRISYGVACYYQGSYIIYFGGYEEFVSIYPVADLGAELDKLVAPYRSGKGTARFYNDKPLPKDLIVEIVKALETNKNNRLSKE